MLKVIGLGESHEGDDPKALPGRYINVWKNPYRSFGLDERTADISNVRDAFRKLCLSYIPHFMDLGTPKMSLDQVLFAYHKIRGHLKGTAKHVADTLQSNPYMDFQASDILPVLRPMQSSLNCNKDYRACRMLTVEYISSSFKFPKEGSYVAMPVRIFHFEVHYCMRRQTLEHTYHNIVDLHNILTNELVAIPVFPTMSYYDYILESGDVLGPKLAEYLTRIHHMLAGKGKFSPRLLRFLELDFERVQSEEEGIIMSVLDSAGKPRSSVFHIIEESWLVKWRKFVMGRGARRYYPPGRITNEILIKKMKEERQHNLKVVKDYRIVNYNVYRFYELVHGGGPVISRLEDDIYSPYAVSYLQAVIHIQSHIRIYLAKIARERLYSRSLLKSKPVRIVLLAEAKLALKERVELKIRSYQDKRKNEKLREAAMMTQSKWRQKKKYFPEENLQRQRRDQTVFSNVSLMLMNENPGSFGDGIVYEEPLPIIRVGSTTVFERKIEEEQGMVPFQIKRVPGSNTAIVCKTDQSTEYPIDSKLVSINQYPCSNMDLPDIIHKLKTVAWPLYLELEKPIRISLLPSMDAILTLESERVQFSAFKLMLKRGIRFMRYSSKLSAFGTTYSTYETVLRLSEFELFYKTKAEIGKTEAALWRGVSLFNLKFVRPGRVDGSFFKELAGDKAKEKTNGKKSQKPTKAVDVDMCVTVVLEGKELQLMVDPENAFFSNASSAYVEKKSGSGPGKGPGGLGDSQFEHDAYLKEEEAKYEAYAQLMKDRYTARIKDVRENRRMDISMHHTPHSNSNNSSSANAGVGIGAVGGGIGAGGPTLAPSASIRQIQSMKSRVVDDLVDDADSSENDEDQVVDEWEPDTVWDRLVAADLLDAPKSNNNESQAGGKRGLFGRGGNDNNADAGAVVGGGGGGGGVGGSNITHTLASEDVTMDEKAVYNKMYGATVVRMFQMLVEEVRKSQVTMDENGMPIKLQEPKKALRNTAKRPDQA